MNGTTAMRILHFSDLHCGTTPHGLAWLTDKRLLGTLTQRLRRQAHQDWSTLDRLLQLADRLQPDLAVCTGDLCAVSNPDEFNRALQLLEPLRQRLPGRLVYLPGNHDAYVNRPETTAARLHAVRRLNGLSHHAGHLPLKRTVGPLRLLLLDAARPMPPWRSGGVATLQQHAAILRQLIRPRRHGERRALISHFPLFRPDGAPLGWRRGITHDRLFRDLAQDGLLDLILCGHIHTPFLHRHGDCLQICPGSLTLHHHCAVIDVPDNHGTTAIQAQLIDLNQPFP